MKKDDQSGESPEKQHGNRFGTSAFAALVSLLGASIGATAAPSTGAVDANANETPDRQAIEAGSGEQNTKVAIELHSTTQPHIPLPAPKITPKTGNAPNLYVDKSGGKALTTPTMRRDKW